MKRPIQLLLLLAAVAVALTSCDFEKGQSFLIIESIDPANTPFGDILSSDGIVPTDTVEIVFANEVKNPDGFANLTQADIVIDAVTVSFNRIDGGSDTIPSFRQAVTLRVPANGTASLTGFPLLPSTRKLEFPVSDLIFFGFERSTNFTSIRVDAVLEVTGKTVEGDPVYVRGSITMELTDWAD